MFENLNLFKTDILCKFKTLYFFRYFLSLFLSEEKGKKITKESKKKRVRT